MNGSFPDRRGRAGRPPAAPRRLAATPLGRPLVWGQLVGILAGAGGWWLPWVLHASGVAALVLLGLDLGEFFKFTSLWRAGEIQWERQIFYLPPVLAALALAALAAQRGPLARWLLALPAIFLALVVLPPYPYTVAALFSPEFRFQTWSTISALGAIAAALFAPYIVRPPRTALGLVRVALGLAGLTLPLWAFWRVKLILDGLYGRPIVVGPGLFVTLGGFTLLAVTGVRALIQPGRAPASRRASAAASSAAEQPQ
ncbi:MAG: hypothetical protein M5U01_39630 [Ardenticatenaceae bacterium]|nr:hypothetical protein [Ardenticatenaceae bacterium]